MIKFYSNRALRTTCLALIACATLLFVSPAMADDESSQSGVDAPQLSSKPEKLDAAIETGLDHLFTLLGDKSASFDPARIEPMLDFVVNTNDDPKDIKPAKRHDGSGICLRHNMNTDLTHVMKYFYNREIPNFLLSPSTLRLSDWYPGSEFLKRDKPLWDELDSLDQPVLVRGREFESCTPDSFGEAYFRYDVDRLIVLMKYQGKNVLVSISKQVDESDVGRKGAILNDKEWDYFYSGIEGLNRGMIGWMDTYMYNSGSVIVLVEQDKAAKQSTLFLFKWLNAGWAGMNVVKRQHIYEGTVRYARSMAKVLEAPTLTPEQLSEGMKDVDALNKPQINNLIQQYAKNFEARFKDAPKLKKKEYAKVIADGGYAKVLDDDARMSILYLEKLKAMLGMETLINMGGTTAAKPAIKTAEVAVQPES